MRNLYFNVFLDVCNKEEALKSCHDILVNGTIKTLYFVNAHCFNLAQRKPEYLRILNKSDLIFNDGIGMKLGSFLAGVKIIDNLNGTDLIPQIIALGARLNKKIYLLGSDGGIALKARSVINNTFKQEVVAGESGGFFSAARGKSIIYDINSSKAEILIVGMGVPKQELWIHEVKKHLIHVKLCIAGGAIIDFISGEKRRAPLWIRKLKLEWIYRLYLEPKRLWKRYIIGNLAFFYYVFKFFLIKWIKHF